VEPVLATTLAVLPARAGKGARRKEPAMAFSREDVDSDGDLDLVCALA
jgi:hypothetical protein